MRPFGVILLAAGGSRRLGRPKQLVPIQEQPLVAHVATVALEAGPAEVIVVLGASSAEVQSALDRRPVRTVFNPDWESGMAGSIKIGVDSLTEAAAAVVILACDQPLITASHVQKLAEIAILGKVAASFYNGVGGVPCSFPRSYFSRLAALRGDTGARELVRTPKTELVPFEAGAIDLDVAIDFEKLGL